MYLSGPEGIALEFATSAAPIDADEWLDPAVVALCGISEADLARYRRPPRFQDRAGAVPQPDPRARPGMQVPPELEAIFTMSDGEIAERLSFPTPPAPKRRAG
jgi:hypothetical protein